MSDDELDALLDCYSTNHIKSIFKKQLKDLKTIDNSVQQGEFVPAKDAQGILRLGSLVDGRHGAKKEVENNKNEVADEVILDDASPDVQNYSDVEIVEESPSPRRYQTRSRSKITKTAIQRKPRNSKKRTIGRRNVCNKKSKVQENSEFEEDAGNHETSVKVLWKSSNIIRISIRQFEKLESIYEYFKKLENVPREQILLTFKGNRIKATDSIDSLQITLSDFIEGGIVANLASINNSNDKKSSRNVNSFSIKFQNSSKKVVVLPIDVKEKMIVPMSKFSELVNVSLSNLKFYFDGEFITGSDTAEGLGIENGEVVDVKY